MKHYVITGGAGLLGSQLISSLQKNGDFTKCVVIDPTPYRPFDTIKLDTSFVEYIQGSFLDETVLNRVLSNCVTVFHLCAIGHTGRFGAQKYKGRVQQFNVLGTIQLIKKCKENGVQRFIYSSSIAVVFTGKPLYSCNEAEPYPKQSEYLDIYSSTKAEAESFILSQSCLDFKTTCLRFRAIYGPQDVSVAEKVVNMVRKNLFMVKISRHDHESISNMSSAENCGQAFHLANQVLAEQNGPHGQAYFITDGETVGQYEVWSPLIRALGKTPPVHSVPYPIVSAFVSISSFFCYEIFHSSPPMTRFELETLVTDNTYSIEKAEKELGYVPGKNHFKKTVDYYRIQPIPSTTHNFGSWFNFDTLLFMILIIFWTIISF
ncbi:hypothetical protein GCK72_024346 [Caenorhabditis remanei]|uniref:3-beta hydroxysteroid dehydrogenase/isomerase domain-containing protein n=1 Tax=Caenorhabditis remanei TaxID=31234 RepID=A0A6A5FYW5_CAERE|nr:hypothetical protein GCK72_024346 [Caenorhabditis remanei]KAF1747880.1 hypothetical protein GCK72_024346 [Caenorhabditis remanei]